MNHVCHTSPPSTVFLVEVHVAASPFLLVKCVFQQALKTEVRIAASLSIYLVEVCVAATLFPLLWSACCSKPRWLNQTALSVNVHGPQPSSVQSTDNMQPRKNVHSRPDPPGERFTSYNQRNLNHTNNKVWVVRNAQLRSNHIMVTLDMYNYSLRNFSCSPASLTNLVGK